MNEYHTNQQFAKVWNKFTPFHALESGNPWIPELESPCLLFLHPEKDALEKDLSADPSPWVTAWKQIGTKDPSWKRSTGSFVIPIFRILMPSPKRTSEEKKGIVAVNVWIIDPGRGGYHTLGKRAGFPKFQGTPSKGIPIPSLKMGFICPAVLGSSEKVGAG